MKQTVSVSPGHPAQLSLALLIISDINVMRGGGGGNKAQCGPVKTSEDQSVININLFLVVPGHSRTLQARKTNKMRL